jgi:hypothetical protein
MFIVTDKLKRRAHDGKSDPAHDGWSGARRLILTGTLLYGAFSSFHPQHFT